MTKTLITLEKFFGGHMTVKLFFECHCMLEISDKLKMNISRRKESH